MKKALTIIGVILVIAFIGALLPDDSTSSESKSNSKPVGKVEELVGDEKKEKEELQQEAPDESQEALKSEVATTNKETEEVTENKSRATNSQTTQQDVASNNNVSVTVPTHEDTTGNLVWVPINGGKKYHSKSSCSNMINPEQITKEHAETNGYTACKRCY